MTDPKLLVIPLSIESGLVYMQSIRIPTDKDLKQYPHVFFTSPDTWDASALDHVTENAQKGYLVDCQEDVPYTALTIVCTINVSIDCDWFQVPNPSIRKNILKIKSSQ